MYADDFSVEITSREKSSAPPGDPPSLISRNINTIIIETWTDARSQDLYLTRNIKSRKNEYNLKRTKKIEVSDYIFSAFFT